MELTELAKSKINLSLNLSGIKIDSYHDLVTFICFGNFSDKLSLKTSQSFSYKVNSFGKNICLKDDLVLKVIHKIKDMYSLKELPKIDLILKKNIPIGSGLGGGSADAAAAIRLMNNFLSLGMTENEMCNFGKGLGSDIPSCIASIPVISYGRGEKLIKVDFKKKYQMLVIYPNIEISTKKIFNLIKTSKTKLLDPYETKKIIESIAKNNDLAEMKNFSNDLQYYAFKAYPVLKKVIDALNSNKSFSSRMTGSGSACFGFFEDESIDLALRKITKDHPDWLVKKTFLNDL